MTEGPSPDSERSLYLLQVYPLLDPENLLCVPLAGEAIRVGRDPEAGIARPDDKEMSRHHATLSPADDGWAVQDAGSTNGTHVNGEPVKSTPLQLGDLLRLGSHFFQVREDSTEDPKWPVVRQWGLVGGASVEAARTAVREAAERRACLLVTGDVGTGKGLVARAVATSTERSDQFVEQSCSAIPTDLIDVALFGRAAGRGAARVGIVRKADGGCLLLRDIDVLPSSVQDRLLRFIESGEFTPVGSEQTETADVQLVCSTPGDLARATEEGRFSRTLCERLGECSVELPALVDRLEDVPAIAAHLLGEAGRSAEASVLRWDVVDALLGYHWPGNVRQLVETMKHAHEAAPEDGAIFPTHLPGRITTWVKLRNSKPVSVPPPAIATRS